MKARLVVSLVFCALIALPTLCLSSALGLPQTGQKTCYAEDGSLISCAGTRQDGAIQAGAA